MARKIECADCEGVFDQKQMNVMTNTVICDGCLERRQNFHRECDERDRRASPHKRPEDGR